MGRRRPGRSVGDVRELVRRALAEDRADEDITSRALLPRPVPSEGTVTAEAPGVFSGGAYARAAAHELGVRLRALLPDGKRVRRGTVVLVLRGDARRLLALERTLLNFLMHASGVATQTARAVDAARSARSRLEVWGTRKTLPGLRDLEKAALVHGGGRPHRHDLAESVLVKNNHLAFVPLELAARRARAKVGPRGSVEVEVRSRSEALRAARAGVDRLLLDNRTPAQARGIVRALERAGLRRGRWVELSGGITPENVGRYRDVGADAVSLGGLTHSAPALPLHLKLRPLRLSRSPP